jgi:Fe-S cluster assembly ATP-binding protein
LNKKGNVEAEDMLEIKQLAVAIDSKEILHDVNLTIKAGETNVLFGPNGSGKTTLLMAIMGFPKYQVTKGSIIFMGKDITRLPLDERARMGIGMSFQRPPVVRGVKTRDMISACLGGHSNDETIGKLASRADLSDFLERDINLGFFRWGDKTLRNSTANGTEAAVGSAG